MGLLFFFHSKFQQGKGKREEKEKEITPGLSGKDRHCAVPHLLNISFLSYLPFLLSLFTLQHLLLLSFFFLIFFSISILNALMFFRTRETLQTHHLFIYLCSFSPMFLMLKKFQKNQ